MINITYFADKLKSQQAAIAVPYENGSEPRSRAADGFVQTLVSQEQAARAALPVTFRGIVYPWHLDHMGHMNVQHYVGMFDQSSWVLMAMLGMDASYFRDNHRGMAALEQTIQYKRELRAGDMFEIRSTILEVHEKTIRLCHGMHLAGTNELAASTTILGVHLDTNARKSLPLPVEMYKRASALIASEALNTSSCNEG